MPHLPPRRTAYRLTARGNDLIMVLSALTLAAFAYGLGYAWWIL